jgi:hypothetical protein
VRRMLNRKFVESPSRYWESCKAKRPAFGDYETHSLSDGTVAATTGHKRYKGCALKVLPTPIADHMPHAVVSFNHDALDLG